MGEAAFVPILDEQQQVQLLGLLAEAGFRDVTTGLMGVRFLGYITGVRV